jgi:hypothetical protein
VESGSATAREAVSDHIIRGLPGLSGKTLGMEMDLPMMLWHENRIEELSYPDCHLESVVTMRNMSQIPYSDLEPHVEDVAQPCRLYQL